MEGVRHRYDQRSVLHIPALTLYQGEVLAVVGPSGAGKSTLLRLLALLETPSEGRVSLYLEGAEVNAATAHLDQRRALAMVFQHPVLLSRSVYQNVAYGLRVRGQRGGRAIINEVLDQLALADLASASAKTLSGGEAQRVALARSLVLQPHILLLDEPTANLDPANVRLIEDLIRAQNQRGTTIILVTHNIFQARRLASRVILLLSSDLIEDAPVEPFFNAPRDPRTALFVSGDFIY